MLSCVAARLGCAAATSETAERGPRLSTAHGGLLAPLTVLPQQITASDGGTTSQALQLAFLSASIRTQQHRQQLQLDGCVHG